MNAADAPDCVGLLGLLGLRADPVLTVLGYDLDAMFASWRGN
jgi:hypothetical protein